MLDKSLVQPPGNIIGLICLGLLWRPLVYNKFSLQNMKRLHPAAMTMLIIALGVCGSFALYRQGIGSALFRQAFIKQHQGRFQAAYEKYAEAARIQPSRARAHIFAANLARARLGEPSKALKHFQRIYPKEESFGHINRDVAFTHAALENHEAAYSFFRREADIFPLKVEAQRNVVRSAIISGISENLERYVQQLRKSRTKLVTYELGEHSATEMAAEFLQAVREGEKSRANYWAEQLRGPLDSRGLSIFLRKFLKQKVINIPLRDEPGKMTAHEWEYWQSVCFWSGQREKMGDARFIPEIIALVRCGPQILKWGKACQSQAYIQPEPEIARIYDITRILNYSGFSIQFLKTEAQETPFLLQIRNTDGGAWLWNTASGALRKGGLRESEIGAELSDTFKQKLSQRDRILVSLPFFSQQCLKHVEALHQLLQGFHALEPPRGTERPAIQKLRVSGRIPAKMRYRYNAQEQDAQIQVRLDIPFVRDSINMSK